LSRIFFHENKFLSFTVRTVGMKVETRHLQTQIFWKTSCGERHGDFLVVISFVSYRRVDSEYVHAEKRRLNLWSRVTMLMLSPKPTNRNVEENLPPCGDDFACDRRNVLITIVQIKGSKAEYLDGQSGNGNDDPGQCVNIPFHKIQLHSHEPQRRNNDYSQHSQDCWHTERKGNP